MQAPDPNPCLVKPSPCQHNGYCSPYNDNQDYQCSCSGTGYVGDNCEVRGRLVCSPLGLQLMIAIRTLEMPQVAASLACAVHNNPLACT